VRVFSDQQSLEIAPLPVVVGSTIGAGDGFAAGFLAALLRGATLDEALRRGNASAALVVGQTMCSEAMPRSAEIDALLQAHPEIVPRQCKPFR
jgi:5-dehydro-2-deoxygluconokinase